MPLSLLSLQVLVKVIRNCALMKDLIVDRENVLIFLMIRMINVKMLLEILNALLMGVFVLQELLVN